MLDLTMGGRTISGEDAVRFFESVPDMLDEEVKTEEFCNKYEWALNRLRFEVRKSVPIAPRVNKGRFESYSCGHCGFCLDRCIVKFCQNCGRAVDWRGL